MKNQFFEELQWRGILQDCTPDIENTLKQEMVTAYIGFDPTADSLHIGNLMQIITLTRLQSAGHKPIVLIGGATGMIGDPSGKSTERNLLSIDEIEKNKNAIKNQLAQFLNFNTGPNKAEMLDNYDWFKQMSFLEFARDIGKHLTVNYMMAKDSVKSRLSGDTGMSFTEFTYQLIQGFDFYYLHKHHNCTLQLGGSDQWGNITTGIELIRRKSNATAYGITTKLIKKSDGSKFGKSEGGNIWLDRNKTSPYKFYQFWLNISDDDAHTMIKVFSFKNQEEVDKLYLQHKEAPHERFLQKALAQEVTIRVHSEADYNQAVETSLFLFKSTADDLLKLDEHNFYKMLGGIDTYNVSQNNLQNDIQLIALLTEHTDIFKSKTEARTMLKSNAVAINKTKQMAETFLISKSNFIHHKYLLVSKGKKEHYLILVSN